MTFFYRRTRASGTVPARPAPRAQAALADALQALGGPFIVADLETTGLSTSSCEILEFAAVRVGAGGVLEREYTQVVRTCGPVPSFISRLTGITQAEVERDGVPVVQAFSSFLAFVEDLPVFFHNASFDRRFLGAAAEQTGLPFPNATHCTLALADQLGVDIAQAVAGKMVKNAGKYPADRFRRSARKYDDPPQD